MSFEILFSLAGVVAMSGWLLLLLSPLMPEWSDRLAGVVLPLMLSFGYLILLILPASAKGGGFGTLADVMDLFSYEQAALAGWVHFLAFDLFIGAWLVGQQRRKEYLSYWSHLAFP
ncbi:protein of unknown function [Shimia haliotis]|uniref:DUF4281 domain-containing protein n=2 Tax=Shimia haliotis TaxID=1280847 RepID=A0A1I4GZ76_9RHOB|nr:protein of unknown function [Shimia haliotis]